MTMRERTFHLQAVVLHHQDWGEADRILTLFSREKGKIRAVARGVRKLRSRKAGHLEPFTRVDLFLASSHDLPIVTQAETVENYQVLRDDLVLIGTASYVVELLDRFTYEEGENTGIYNLLVETLSRLASGMPPALVVRYYELRLLDFTGFRPNLFTCVRCENDIQAQDQFFSFDEGGVLCPGCGAGLPGALPVSLTALKYLRHLQRSSFSEARKSGIKPEVQPEIENLLQRYITHILERRLNSPGFLRLVRNQEQAGKTGTSVAQGNAPNPLEPVNPGDVRQ